MTIDNLQAYVDSVWDWDKTLGMKNATGDIDGHRERKGHHLFVCAKPAGYTWKWDVWGMTAWDADWEAHVRLADNGNCTVWVLYGEPNCPVEMQVITQDTITNRFPVDNDKVKELFKSWNKWAESKPMKRLVRIWRDGP